MNLHNISTLICSCLFVMVIKYRSCQEIENENICLKHPGNLIIANPDDCYSFFACQYGNAMKIICPNNSMFNPKLGNCDSSYSDCIIKDSDNTLNDITDKMELLSEDMPNDDDDDADTTDFDDISNTETVTTELSDLTTPQFSDSDSTTNLSTETSTNLSIDSTTEANTSTVTSEESPNDCETTPTVPPYIQCPLNDTDVPSFLASDLYCDSYYLCYHGRPFEMFCPIGFHWSQEHKICILKRQSNCTDSSAGNKVPKCPLIGQFFIPHYERCNLFYYCENGVRSVQQCTAFKQWDVVERTCKLDFIAKCIKTIPTSQRAKYYAL